MNRSFLIYSVVVLSLNDLCAQVPDSDKDFQLKIFPKTETTVGNTVNKGVYDKVYDISYSITSKNIEKILMDKASKGNEYKNYDKAKKYYSELLKVDSTNPEGNYGMALTHYANYQQIKSIPYLEKAIKYSKSSIPEAYYFLGNSYHLSGNYDKAEQDYNTYLSLLYGNNSLLPEEEVQNAKNDIIHKIAMCENGKHLASSTAVRSPLLQEGKKITLSSIDNTINNSKDDFGSVFSANDSIIYFTSKRKDAGDIYFSRLQNNRWTPAENIGFPINTAGHESIINISSDGNRLYFYRSSNLEDKVYYSDFKANHWNFPQELLNPAESENIFKGMNIFSFALTPIKNELYIISDKKGGIGGRDIYVSKKLNDSVWGNPENLGAPINSEYDEVTVSFSPDGNTMYFSSNGNNSIGGFDVFVSKRKDGQWSQPVNLGVPINTPGDDLFFSFLNTGSRASYSSSANASDDTRDLDIFYVDFCDDVKENTIKGIALGIPAGSVSVTDILQKSNVAESIIRNGKYSFNLNVGRQYSFVFDIPGILPVHTELTIPVPTQCKRYNIYQQITFTAPGEMLNIKSALIDLAYETEHPDITAYPKLMENADKSKLLNYTEINLPTFSIEAASNYHLIYDTNTGEKLSSVSPVNTPTNSDDAKMEATNKAELSKFSSAMANKAVTTVSFGHVFFDFGKSCLNKSCMEELDKAAELIKNAKPENEIEIAGYADSKGMPEYNLALSKQRAEAVAQYLMTKKINKNKMKIVGYGDTKPIAADKNSDGTDNPSGREKNRRTEIVIK